MKLNPKKELGHQKIKKALKNNLKKRKLFQLKNNKGKKS
tara:strand:+ start:4576 stop:4692 length:117 start_codon:yes stop_codon:yes gene_type:complete